MAETRKTTLEAEMSFFDHLTVLRKHLLRSLLALMIFTVGAFFFSEFIYEEIIMGPKQGDFWTYRMMCALVAAWPNIISSDFCVTNIPGEIINTQMAGQFTLMINSSIIVGIVLTIPYLLYELWLFIKPALKVNEKKSARGFVFFSSSLFFIGVLFGYYVISPLSINFLANYTVSADIKNTFTIDSYLSTVATLTLGSGIIFQLPIVIYILSKLGIMTPKFMRSSRRYSTVLILIIAAVVTPTADVLTMMVVAAPLFLLYEISIYLSAAVERQKNKEIYGVAREDK